MDQKEQKESIIKLAKLVMETGKLYSEALMSFADIEANKEKILALESEGDTIQYKLDDHFSQEKNIPYLALDRARLVRRLDDILDQVALSARVLSNFSKFVKSDFGTKMEPLAKICQEITGKLADGVEIIYSSFKEALTISKEVENLRDAAMEKTFTLEASIIGDQDTEWRQYEASRRIMMESMKLIRATKDCSEVLEIMSLKYD